MDRIVELEVFVSILDAGSLAAASLRLNRSPSGVTRILSDLERRMGVSLIERSARRCRPTDAGRRFADQARHILANYDEALADAASAAHAPRGAIRITAPLLFGRDHVAPAIAGFLDRYEGITVDLHLADRKIDLSEENIDLAVRIGAVTDPSLIVRKVGTVRRMVVASPAYLAAHGTPLKPHDVGAHRVIDHGAAKGASPWLFAGRDGRTKSVKVSPRWTVNQVDVAIRFALEGRGLATALSYQVLDALRSGQLVRLLQDFEPPALPVALVYPESSRTIRRVRLLADHLAAHIDRSYLTDHS